MCSVPSMCSRRSRTAKSPLRWSIAEMIRHDRAAGRAPDGLDAEVMASVLLEFNDRLLERLTLGGPLSREQLMDGAAAIWLSTIYGVNGAQETT